MFVAEQKSSVSQIQTLDVFLFRLSSSTSGLMGAPFSSLVGTVNGLALLKEGLFFFSWDLTKTQNTVEVTSGE